MYNSNRFRSIVVASFFLLASCHENNIEPVPDQQEEPEPNPGEEPVPEPVPGNTWQQDREGAFLPGSVRFETRGIIYTGLGMWTKSGDTVHPELSIAQYDSGSTVREAITSYPSGASYNCIAIGLNGKAYVGGGWHPKALYSDIAFYEYDPSSKLWTAKAPVPIASRNWHAFSFNNRGFISLDQNVWEYSVVNNEWIEGLSDIPEIPLFSSFRIGTREYLVGANLSEYDHDTQKWTAKGTLPLVPTFAFVINDELYIGSRDGFWKYQTAKAQWLQLPNCPSQDMILYGYSESGNGYVGTTEFNLDSSDSHIIYRYSPSK